MSWCFRLRFDLGATAKLEYEDREWILCDGPLEHVVLLPADGQDVVANARRLQVRGALYSSEEEAAAAGRRWRDWITLIFASVNVGADFGDRAATGGATSVALKEASQAAGCQVYNDIHGLMTFPDDPSVLFLHFGPVAAMVSSPHSRLVEALNRVQSATAALTTRQRLAYDLFSASLSEINADARFVMLMMAVETLVDQQPRSPGATSLVDSFLAEVKQADLPAAEIASLTGALRYLRNESINQSGRRIAATLEGRTYQDEDPVTFFKRCYALRSDLVHGAVPRPDRSVVGYRAANLEHFVSHLITGLLLDAPS